ncbi:unnamed protein product [Dracunculus medinensis]|uniref:ADF-H domain-containing protein n=1 Tax=Dracunculus medinensis TaxID=318479 RepID=A0A0N4UDX3_DRAME|nr:unnamed protein product [Dracunculus medinensis]
MSVAQKAVIKNPQKLQEFYSDIREKKINSYVIFEILRDGTIVVDEKGPIRKSYAEFLERFFEISRGRDECLYAMVDVEVRPGTKKFVFLLYCGDQITRQFIVKGALLFCEMKTTFRSADLQLMAADYRDIAEDSIKRYL